MWLQAEAEAEAPIEKQISRWRQEVFKLLLASKQGQLVHKQHAEAQAQTVARLERELKAAEDSAMLLDKRLMDKQVDLDLACVKGNRAEAQLHESYRCLAYNTCTCLAIMPFSEEDVLRRYAS